jgi:hypothetical protein
MTRRCPVCFFVVQSTSGVSVSAIRLRSASVSASGYSATQIAIWVSSSGASWFEAEYRSAEGWIVEIGRQSDHQAIEPEFAPNIRRPVEIHVGRWLRRHHFHEWATT